MSVEPEESGEEIEPHEIVKKAVQPDPDGAGAPIADALRRPDFRTKTSAPSTSEKRLTADELPDPTDSTQG